MESLGISTVAWRMLGALVLCAVFLVTKLRKCAAVLSEVMSH